MTEKNKIGILTGGGDVPGLNPVIKSVVYGASEFGRQVTGIRKGWEGLVNMTGLTDSTYVRELTRENTRTIDRTGGTVLHTARTNPRCVAEANVPKHLSASKLKELPFDGKYYDFTPIVIENLERLGVGCLVAIGGDDTLSFASVLSAAGFPVIAIPKTMDNDVQGTEYCIGFSTAVTRAKQSVTRQRTTVGSHERIGIFRIFGRDAGFTALYTAYVTSERCLIPEYPFDLDRVCRLLMEDKASNPSNYALIIVSEGAIWTGGEVQEYGEADAYGHRKKSDIGHALAEEVRLAHGTGDDGQRPDLRPAQRRARFDRSTRSDHVREHRCGPDSRWCQWKDDRNPERLLRASTFAGCIPWCPQGQRGEVLQHRAVPAQLQIKARSPAAVRLFLRFIGEPRLTMRGDSLSASLFTHGDFVPKPDHVAIRISDLGPVTPEQAFGELEELQTLFGETLRHRVNILDLDC